jgi:antitoxin ParD1/3/4
MPRSSRPVTVTLGELQDVVDARVNSGRYASASEVLRAGLRALDREEAALDDWMRRKVEQSLADSRADIPIEDAFDRLRAHAAKRNA